MNLEEETESDDFHPGELERLLEEGERSGAPLDGEQVLRELRQLRAAHQGQDPSP